MHRPPQLPYENVLVGSSILNSRWKLSDRHGATCLYRGGCISHSRSYSNDRASCRSYPCTIAPVRPGCSRKTYKYASDLSSGIIQRVKSQSQRADSQCVITIYIFEDPSSHRRRKNESDSRVAESNVTSRVHMHVTTNTNWIVVTNIGQTESSRFAIFFGRSAKRDTCPEYKWDLNIPIRSLDAELSSG